MAETQSAGPDGAEPQQGLDALVRRADEDRWLTARFAPEPARAGLAAVYAFNLEIARIAEHASEPMLGEIRLQWWREALDEISQGGPARGHELALALDEAASRCARTELCAALTCLIDARARDLDGEPFADLEALGAYAEASAGGVMRAAAVTCGAELSDPDAERFLRACARAWGLTALMRAFAPLAADGRAPVPRTLKTKYDLPDALLAQRGGRSGVTAALGEIGAAAQSAYDDASRQSVDVALWPALGYVALVPGYLKQMAKPDRDPYADAGERLLLARQWRLLISSLSGRI